MVKTIIIDGTRIHDIPSFYEEINRVFMANVDWKLGQSLDALDDMFYGGYGEIDGSEEITLIWKNFEQNRQSLGLDTTKAYYQNKLESPAVYNIALIQDKLAELQSGRGETYIEIVLKIIGEHKNITIKPE